MKISWLSLNASWSHSSLALPMLERCCREEQEWQWLMVESTINEAPERVVERILEQEPDVILATGYLFTIEPILSVLSRLSRLRPELAIVLGGPEFLGQNRDFLARHPFVHAVVRGEGEAVILDLLRIFERGDECIENWMKLPGVSCRLPASDIHDDGKHAPELQMEALQNPMLSPLFDWNKKFVQIETSRGCRSICNFCTSAISTGGRMLSVEEVRSHLLRIRQAGIKNVRVLDRTFNHPQERAVELVRMFLKDFDDLHFHLEIYPNLVTEPLLELIEGAKPNQLHVEIGIQSTNSQVLSSIKRSLFKSRSHDVVKRLSNIENVPIHADLIVGLPNQTFETFKSDLELLSEYLPEEIQIEVLKVLNGTPLTKELPAYGIVHSPSPPYEVLETATLSFTEIRQCMRLSRLLDHFYNHCELHTIVGKYWEANPSFWVELETYLTGKADFENPMNLSTRYQLLFEFLSDKDPKLADELAIEWIRKGHSPSKGLWDTQLWKGDLPLDVVTVHEENSADKTDSVVNRDARMYYLSFKNRDYWIRIFRHDQKRTEILGEWEKLIES